ncbi:hypothetical protein C1I98_12410, partial [Spongiactinospora gelatinilytica]
MPRPERAIDPGGGVVAQFALELREIRRAAGNPGYRELARRTHYSPATLAAAAAGNRLPSLAVTLAYVRACGADETTWRQCWHTAAAELGAQPAGTGSGDGPATRPPYLGLAAYGSDDADLFFGRDHLPAALIERLAIRPFLALIGASGSGKSSLLRAGLLPAAAAQGHATLLITPGAHPLRECATALGTALEIPSGDLITELGDDVGALGAALRRLATAGHDDRRALLIVDQFEEVFTLCTDEQEREWFIAALPAAAAGPDDRARVVLGLRADFYAHCARHGVLVEALQDGQVLVGPMNAGELREVVTRPAAVAGLG